MPQRPPNPWATPTSSSYRRCRAGGTSILGGRGSYLGTVAGVMLITLLQSILSVMQMPEFGRQIVYGVVIVSMLLLYGREQISR